VTDFLDAPPYAERRDDWLLERMAELTRFHAAHCPPYRRILGGWQGAETLADIPYLHVGVFKHLEMRTQDGSIVHERTLNSSATSSGMPSRIVLDRDSARQQARAAQTVLKDFVGGNRRVLLLLDSSRSLRRSGLIAARTAAAMSLLPFAERTVFLLDDADNPASLREEALLRELEGGSDFLVYGFTWLLWFAWARAPWRRDRVAALLRGKTITFVHSGGWKRLENARVSAAELEQALLEELSPQSRVIDFYGLAEQSGVVFPACPAGWRHVPFWADVIVRDPVSWAPMAEGVGVLQLMNPIPRGSPYHSVVTEDLGEAGQGPCPCGRHGKRFRLIGRVPRSEVRGCANV
jgi:hypothetical protein